MSEHLEPEYRRRHTEPQPKTAPKGRQPDPREPWEGLDYPTQPDTPRHYDAEHFTDNRRLRHMDSDHDHVSDAEEIAQGTDPLNPDTDADGIEDGWERGFGTDPLNPDTDRDGMWDREELINRTNPTVKDGPRPRPPLEEQLQGSGVPPIGPPPPSQGTPSSPGARNVTDFEVPDKDGRVHLPDDATDRGPFGPWGAVTVEEDVFGRPRIVEPRIVPDPDAAPLMDVFGVAAATPAPAPGAGPAAPTAPSAPGPDTVMAGPAASTVPSAGPAAPTIPGAPAPDPATAGRTASIISDAAEPVTAPLGGSPPVGAPSARSPLTGPPVQTAQGTTLERRLPDGSVQQITVDNDGGISRSTERVNPSTGAVTVDRHLADGTRIREEQLPDGRKLEVKTYPDGSTERMRVEHNSDGSRSVVTTDRDGWTTETRTGTDPDGTEWEQKLLPPDNRIERRTRKETTQPDGSTVVETTDPSGTGREVRSADGRHWESVFTFTDGRQEKSFTDTDAEGRTVTVFTHADGRSETLTKETLPNGTVREVLRRSDGGTETTLTTTLENPDGSTTIDVDAPDADHRTTTWPNGATETTVKYDDGTSERQASGFHPDGSKWHFTQNRDGTWQHVEQPLGGTTSIVSRSDGTWVQTSVAEGIDVRIRHADGSMQQTDVDLDGAGKTQVFDPTGKVVSETLHDGELVEPYPDLGDDDRDIPILKEADARALDERGVVGRVAADEVPDADVIGDTLVEADVATAKVAAALANEAPTAPASEAPAEPDAIFVPEPAAAAVEAEPVLTPEAEPVGESMFEAPAYASEPQPEPEPEPSVDDMSSPDS